MKPLFRQEALAHRAGSAEKGDLLRFDPRWVKIAYKLVIAAAVVGAIFIVLMSVDEYAAGPAVVRVDGRRMVTATAPGSVDVMDIKPGTWVDEGTILVRMSDTDEKSELERATREFELQLVRLLADPNDGVAKSTLASLRSRREQARNAVESRTVRAQSAGLVSDVRVRPGQHVNPGDVLCAIVPKDATQVSLVAMVPADYRPMLKPGLKMRFELDGFRYEYSDVEVEDVSAEAVGPTEVMRFLGQERGDTVRLDQGGKVFVTARLPASTFLSEGQSFGYFDGLTGTAEVRVRRESILVTLIPALRQVFP